MPSSQPAEPARGNELLRDPGFRQGFTVWAPAAGRHVAQGKLRPEPAVEPVWGLAQWHSRYSLAGVEPQTLPGGAVEFRNTGKTVRFAPPGSGEADLVLSVFARTEYDGQPHRKKTPWVHLLAEQSLSAHPAIKDLQAVRFRLSCRLRKDDGVRPAEWNGDVHDDAAQFQAFITLQNFNRKSKGFGDYCWFGVPLYDSRWPLPREHAARDTGTGKFIYSPPGSAYTDHDLRDGRWNTVDRDLLPLMREGLKRAWAAGFLKDSRDPADFHLGSFNIGWEVPGLHDVSMQIRGLSLATEVKPASSP